MTAGIAVHPVGVIIALAVLAAISRTLYWMLHPPVTIADRAAKDAEQEVAEMIGSVIVVFSEEIHSEHMMSLAVRVARRERAKLLALYVLEVPHALPLDAEMEPEMRRALGVLQVAETIGTRANIEIRTEVVRGRVISQPVLDTARATKAHLILLGAYREGSYEGAPLARPIEVIAQQAKCDVLIGIQGKKGKILATPEGTKRAAVAGLPGS